MELSANLKLSAASDSDWAGDKKRLSRNGYDIYMGTAAVVWCSKLQKSVALSPTEAEYVALTGRTIKVKRKVVRVRSRVTRRTKSHLFILLRKYTFL
jgi:hypothetical protein